MGLANAATLQPCNWHAWQSSYSYYLHTSCVGRSGYCFSLVRVCASQSVCLSVRSHETCKTADQKLL